MSGRWTYAAVHLSDLSISVVATGSLTGGEREFVGAATALVDDGRLVFGDPSENADLPPLLFIDDPSIPVGTELVDRELVLRGMLSHALSGAGVVGQLNVLEIASPSHWGERRTNVVRTAASPLADEVILVETRMAAIVSAGERAPSAAVVIEPGEHETSVVLLGGPSDTGDGVGGVVPYRVADGDVWRDEVRASLGRLVRHCPVDVFVVTDDVGLADLIENRQARCLAGIDIARALFRRAGADLQPIQAPITPTRSAAWLQASAPVAQPRRERSYRAAALTAVGVAVVSAAAVAFFTSGSGETDNAVAAQPFSPIEASVELSVPPPAPPPAVVSEPVRVPDTTFVLGRVSLRLPANWSSTEESDRLVLVPIDPPDRRIVVTVLELNPGAGLDLVAEDLQSEIVDRGTESSIGSFVGPTDFGGRVGISYTETPGDASTVEWRVFVDSDLQISIGCQYEGGSGSSIDTACDQAASTLQVAPAV